MKNKTNIITINGIGIALFVVLSLCLQVPVFENYYLCLGYVVMVVYLYFFGIKSGIIIGFLGTIIYCFLINGLRGMLGWALGNIFIAVILGYSFKLGGKISKNTVKYLIFITGIIISCTCGILIIKSFVEYLLYAQPIIVRMVSNIYAFVADLIVIIFSVPICRLLEPCMSKIYK